MSEGVTMAWFNLGWLQVVWFVVVVYAVTAAVVHLCLRRLLRRRAAAEAEARGEHLSAEVRTALTRTALTRTALTRTAQAAARRIGALRTGATRLIAFGTPSEVVLLPRPHVQVPQIAARPSRPAPRVGLSEGVPTMAITLVPRQRVVDLTVAERLPVPQVGGPVRWWHGART
jgi:hypothetical protein